MRNQRRLRHVGWAAIIWMSAGLPAFGQDSKDDIIEKLISRAEALEREVAALKRAATSEQIVAEPQPQPVAAAAIPAAVEQAAAIRADVSEPVQASESRFTFHGYADVDFLRNPDGNSIKEFDGGELDLFATAVSLPSSRPWWKRCF